MILNKSEYVGGRGKKQRNTILIGSYVETKSVIIKESNFSFHYCCGIPKISQVREEKFFFYLFYYFFFIRLRCNHANTVIKVYIKQKY
jgi:hypothetical protein